MSSARMLSQTPTNKWLTVKPRGSRPSASVLPRLSRIKLSRHSAQKSRLVVSLLALGNPPRSGPYSWLGGVVHIQLLAILLLLLLGQAVLGLSHLKLAVAEQGDEADAQVGAAQVESEVLADFLAGGVLPVSFKAPKQSSRLGSPRKRK